jgi:peptidoglycan hydrolase-like protein with peptidoglycan-binding domain
MSQPVLNPVNIGAVGAAVLLGGLGYAFTNKPGYAAAGAVTGLGLVLGYFKVIEPGRIYMFAKLRPGARGLAVAKAQERLLKHGYPPLAGETPGVFGTFTQDAVKKFQNARGLPTTGVIDSATWSELAARPKQGLTEYDTNDILKTMRRLGYKVSEDGKWNIVGLRSRAGSTNSFDDEMHLLRKTAKGWEHYAYPMTADPGTYYLTTPYNGQATSAVVPGQYPDAYTFGLHRGQYEALVQIGHLKVYRDGNRDERFDYDPRSIVTGVYGINIHKASADSKSVDKWSAGCQVFARERDFTEFLNLLKQSGQQKFTYTLLAENQVRGLIA